MILRRFAGWTPEMSSSSPLSRPTSGCRGKFLKSNAPPYRPVLALYCTKGARFDQIEHDRILCKRRPCRSVFGRHCHAWTVAGVAGTHGRGGFVGEPTFQRHAEPQVGAARKLFRLVDPIPQAADTAPRRPKREEEHYVMLGVR